MRDKSADVPRAARSIVALLLIAVTAPALAALPAWLTLPAWQQPVDAVRAAEGESAVTHEARPGSQLDGFDFLLSVPAQAGDVALSREFYFDAAQKLALIRIVPAKTDTTNCDALLAATVQAIGKQDELPAGIPLMENRSWFRRKDDRLYRWFQIKSFRGYSANTPCGLSIEPYEAGMARKKKG